MPIECPTCPPLRAGTLCLRPWHADDANALCEAVQASLASVGRWLSWCHAGYGLADATAWIAHCQDGWAQRLHAAFAVVDDASGELLGSVGLSQWNAVEGSANLGYWVRQSRQGKGIATRAASMAAGFGFGTLGLGRIDIAVLPDNLASRRVADKLGATCQGRIPGRLRWRDQARDAVVYTLRPGAVTAGVSGGA